jgi:hypothetical protein
MKCYPHLPQDVHSVLVISWTEKKKKKKKKKGERERAREKFSKIDELVSRTSGILEQFYCTRSRSRLYKRFKTCPKGQSGLTKYEPECSTSTRRIRYMIYKL